MKRNEMKWMDEYCSMEIRGECMGSCITRPAHAVDERVTRHGLKVDFQGAFVDFLGALQEGGGWGRGGGDA